jgi:hypothetical protein
MTRKEAIRQTVQADRLRALGFTSDEATALRRSSLTLQRWHELECGTGEGQVSRSVERDEVTGRPFMRVQYPTRHGWQDQRYPTPDRETGARKRLAAIVEARNARKGLPAGASNWKCDNGTYDVIDAAGTVVLQNLAESEAAVTAYVQGDPRGCALYILPASVTEPAREYPSGVAVW